MVAAPDALPRRAAHEEPGVRPRATAVRLGGGLPAPHCRPGGAPIQLGDSGLRNAWAVLYARGGNAWRGARHRHRAALGGGRWAGLGRGLRGVRSSQAGWRAAEPVIGERVLATRVAGRPLRAPELALRGLYG